MRNRARVYRFAFGDEAPHLGQVLGVALVLVFLSARNYQQRFEDDSGVGKSLSRGSKKRLDNIKAKTFNLEEGRNMCDSRQKQ